ncbi:MAG: hypothetical protein IKR49_10725, partial [Clostridia bacterium]|nr:hypothetical protein [Clostridia bacterium]
MAIVCKPEEFKARVAAQLHDFSTDVLRKISKETETCSKDCVEELRRTSPRRKGKGGGAYARSWTNQKETNPGRWVTTCIVHNKDHY